MTIPPQDKNYRLCDEEVEAPCVRLTGDSAEPIKLPNPDDATASRTPVIRLDASQQHAEVAREPKEPATRLGCSGDQGAPSRTHEPDIEAIADVPVVPAPSVEELWEQEKSRGRYSIPIGWVILPCLLLAGGLFWSLSQWKKGNEGISQTQEEIETQLEDKGKEEREAAQLIDSIQATLRDYFSRTSVEELGALVRHPERVVPLMREHYKDQPVFIGTLSSINALRPHDIDYRTRFWVAAAILSNGHKPLITVEVTPSGAVLIDWESLVCHQPMDWDEYAQKRPGGTTMDFRVYGEPIQFNTHEFEDANEWLCVRLTAYDSSEFLFGYARIKSEAGLRLSEMFKKKVQRKTALTLRLTLPEGLQSPRGVVIDKLLHPGWIQLDPPDSTPPTNSATPPDSSS